MYYAQDLNINCRRAFRNRIDTLNGNEAAEMKLEKQIVKVPNLVPDGAVLLVEDEEDVRKWVRIALISLGFMVFQAKDGIEAVEIFRQHKDEISCLFCDLTMPRMDGWETISTLRAIRHDLPVILTSGYDEDIVMAGKHPELPDFFLGKPYGLYKLGDTIGHAMARKAVARENERAV